MKCKAKRKPFVLNLDERVFAEVRELASSRNRSITSWLRDAVSEKLACEKEDLRFSEIRSSYASLNEDGREWLRSSAVLATNHEEMKEGEK